MVFEQLPLLLEPGKMFAVLVFQPLLLGAQTRFPFIHAAFEVIFDVAASVLQLAAGGLDLVVHVYPSWTRASYSFETLAALARMEGQNCRKGPSSGTGRRYRRPKRLPEPGLLGAHNLLVCRLMLAMEPTGFEPVTSCLQSRRSPN